MSHHEVVQGSRDDSSDDDGERSGAGGLDVDEEPTAEHPAGEDPDSERGPWGFSAARRCLLRRTLPAGGVAGAVASSGPARLAEQASRRVSRPLVREGDQVLDRLEHEAGPAAQQALKQVTPGVVEAVDVNVVLDAIDINSLVDRLDVNRLVDRIDVGAVVAKVDVGELVAQVDVDAIVAQVDLDALLARIDIDALLERIDVSALLARIDLDALLAAIDLDAVLGRMDLDELLGSVDLNRVLAGVDLDALLAGVDLNALLAELDVDALMSQTELGGIIARSTSGVASEALDAVRSQGVGLDGFINRIVTRALRRDLAELPAGPPLLVNGRLALPSPARSDVDGDSSIDEPHGVSP